MMRNALSGQKADGWIEGRTGELYAPLLVQLVEMIYTTTRDAAFVKEVWPGLLKFYDRWLKTGGEGSSLPHWKSAPTLYPFPQADLAHIVAPDLLAYLLNEGEALTTLA